MANDQQAASADVSGQPMTCAQREQRSGSSAFALMYPPKILFGPGRLEELGEEAARFGTRAVVVCGRTAMRKQGILDRALRVLRDSGIACTDFQEVEADPSLATVTGGVRRVSEFRGDLVIGLGGGSAIDAGKAIASMVRQPQSVYAYFDGAEIELPGLPFIAIPTTAGTGAEVTSNAVLTDERCQRKRSLRSPLMTPGTAIVDPELTRSMSPYLTACTGMDALVQAIEAFVTSTPNPVSDVLSSRAIVLITEALPGAVQEGDDAEARVQMALGSLLSGMAFSTSGLGAVHGLAHPIGARFGAPHGHICAILLPAVMRFNLPARRDRFGEIAGLIGLGSAEALIQRIEELLGEVGLLMDLKAWGITQDDLPAIVAESRSGSMGKNPRQASDEELVGLLMELT